MVEYEDLVVRESFKEILRGEKDDTDIKTDLEQLKKQKRSNTKRLFNSVIEDIQFLRDRGEEELANELINQFVESLTESNPQLEDRLDQIQRELREIKASQNKVEELEEEIEQIKTRYL